MRRRGEQNAIACIILSFVSICRSAARPSFYCHLSRGPMNNVLDNMGIEKLRLSALCERDVLLLPLSYVHSATMIAIATITRLPDLRSLSREWESDRDERERWAESSSHFQAERDTPFTQKAKKNLPPSFHRYLERSSENFRKYETVNDRSYNRYLLFVYIVSFFVFYTLLYTSLILGNKKYFVRIRSFFLFIKVKL